MTVSWLNYLDWRARSRSFDMLACSRQEDYTLTGTERAQRLTGRRVTGNFFRVLGVSPAIGRGFTDDDDRPNTPALAVVSDAYWRTKLGADPSAIGQTLRLDGTGYTLVGVMPRDFQYIRPYDVFTSMGPSSGSNELSDRGNHNDGQHRQDQRNQQPAADPDRNSSETSAAFHFVLANGPRAARGPSCGNFCCTSISFP